MFQTCYISKLFYHITPYTANPLIKSKFDIPLDVMLIRQQNLKGNAAECVCLFLTANANQIIIIILNANVTATL